MRLLVLLACLGASLPARADPPPATCTRSFGVDASPPGTAISIDALIKAHPTGGLFTVEGYVQSPHHCGACPPGASCKPCEDDIWLSAVRGAYKDPLSPSTDLRIYVPDASRFDVLGHYQITVELCAHHATGSPLPDLELRGYRSLDPPVVSPRERLAPLRWLLGSWQCAGSLSSFSLAIAETLQGAWLDVHMVMKTQGDPFEVIATLGYARDRGWVRWDRNSNGGTRLMTSPGPTGEAITFATDAAAGGFREELARTTAGLAGRIDSFENGKWSPAATFTCAPAKP